jgi:hypothetical protein
MPRVAPLGDSIFDNAAYRSGGPDVAAQVCKLVPSAWGVSLLAVDGSTTFNNPDQWTAFQNQAAHLVVSVDGNNAITEVSRLGISFFGFQDSSLSHSLASLAEVSETGSAGYRGAPILDGA